MRSSHFFVTRKIIVLMVYLGNVCHSFTPLRTQDFRITTPRYKCECQDNSRATHNRHEQAQFFPESNTNKLSKDETRSQNELHGRQKLIKEILLALNATEVENGRICSHAIHRVDEEHFRDSRTSPLAVESASQIISLPESLNMDEFFSTVTGQRMLVRSRPCNTSLPIFNSTEISIIRAAASSLWQTQSLQDATQSNGAARKSRFTYQRPGNSEAHVHDLFDVDSRVKDIVNEALVTKLYPTLRWAFGNQSKKHDGYSTTTDTEIYNPLSSINLPKGDFLLAVYDALIIRYDADAAKQHHLEGAGQPLHRDLGLCSINIALSTPDEFEGGGTFFENLMQKHKTKGVYINNGAVLKPAGAGEFVAHPCFERHAGCVTTAGVRDIMVLFITAQFTSNQTESLSLPKAPKMERVARLRNAAQAACTLKEKRLINALAVKESPRDGECWANLGTSLVQDDIQLSPIEKQKFATIALQCIKYATVLLPYDARMQNNRGFILSRLKELDTDLNQSEREALDGQIEEAYKSATELNEMCDKAGCDVALDTAVSLLNLGLLYANRNDFVEATQVLSKITTGKPVSEAESNPQRIETFHNAEQLLSFCKKQLAN